MHKDYYYGTRSLVLSFPVLFLSDYWFSQLFRNFFPGSQSLISEDKIKNLIFDEWIVSWPMPWTNILVSSHIFISHFFRYPTTDSGISEIVLTFKNCFTSLNIATNVALWCDVSYLHYVPVLYRTYRIPTPWPLIVWCWATYKVPVVFSGFFVAIGEP